MPGRTDPYPVTPDGRYFVVRGRLWRRANPALPAVEREQLVRELMSARRAVAAARRRSDAAALRRARDRVQAAKEGLGERGPVWWSDGAPDLDRHTARTTPYREWYEALALEGAAGPRRRSRPAPPRDDADDGSPGGGEAREG